MRSQNATRWSHHISGSCTSRGRHHVHSQHGRPTSEEKLFVLHPSLELLQIVSEYRLFSSLLCPAFISVRELVEEIAHHIGAPTNTVSFKVPMARHAGIPTSFCIEDCQGTMLSNSYPSDCTQILSEIGQ